MTTAQPIRCQGVTYNQDPLSAGRHCNRMEAGSAEENLPTRDFWHVIMVGTHRCLPAGWASQSQDRFICAVPIRCVCHPCLDAAPHWTSTLLQRSLRMPEEQRTGMRQLRVRQAALSTAWNAAMTRQLAPIFSSCDRPLTLGLSHSCCAGPAVDWALIVPAVRLQRLYLGRLGDVLRKRQDIASQLQPSLATFDGGRKSVVEYCKVPTAASSCRAMLKEQEVLMAAVIIWTVYSPAAPQTSAFRAVGSPC